VKYLLMRYDDESWWNTVTEEDIATEMEAHRAFSTWMSEHGITELAGQALQSSGTATTLRSGSDGLLDAVR
jgi:hypothetical protein